MGIRIKEVHIKPGTHLLEGVEYDKEMLPGEIPDKNGLVWCKSTYIGFDYKRQYLFIYLTEYWPHNNIVDIIPKLPHCLDHDVPETDPFYQIEPEEGLIGYDFRPDGTIWSEFVGLIYFKPWNKS